LSTAPTDAGIRGFIAEQTRDTDFALTGQRSNEAAPAGTADGTAPDKAGARRRPRKAQRMD
jgi:hypothetical protein